MGGVFIIFHLNAAQPTGETIGAVKKDALEGEDRVKVFNKDRIFHEDYNTANGMFCSKVW